MHMYERDEPDTFNEFMAASAAERKTRMELRRRWDRSLWRISPLPLTSYTIVGTYLWLANQPHPWWKAAAPVIAITIYQSLAPLIRNWWFRRMRKKIEASRGSKTE